MRAWTLLLMMPLILAAPTKSKTPGPAPTKSKTPGSAPPSATAELTRMLNEFLAGASRNDSTVHDRFWADDLIYTGSSGRRIGKADIMRDVRSAPAPRPEDPRTTYSAEDVRIQQYGTAAIVAFRLVATTVSTEATGMARYLNTGTFVQRAGRWQAVAWQATRMPVDEDRASTEVSGVEAGILRAMLASDTLSLRSTLREGFVWTDDDGRTTTRRELLDRLGSGALKFTKLEPRDATVAIYGETAVFRGVATWQRSMNRGSGGAGDATPLTSHYTITFVGSAGEWNAVAMHSGR